MGAKNGFENANYGTADKINETIQDQLDSGKLKIKDITEKKLTGLKVDILNKSGNSFLRVRRDNETIIEDEKLKDNQEIEYTGKIMKNGKKVFLEVKVDGKVVGYSSADYIKGKRIIEKKEKSQTRQKRKVRDKKEKEVTTKVNENKKTRKHRKEKLKKYSENTAEFFGINKSKLEKINRQLDKNGLNLDINQFLNKYKIYINSNLEGLDSVILEKIKKIISIRFLKLSKIIEERIAWVDEQIEEGDYKRSDRKKEIQNQRWIIDSNLQDLFSEVDNKILPSAIIFNRNLKLKKFHGSPYGTTGIKFDNISEIEDMFAADITEDGEFDKTWTSFEFIDANTNSWTVLDASDEDDQKFMEKNSIPKIEGKSLLSKEDIEIRDTATIYWYGVLAGLLANDIATFTGVWAIPGLVIGAGYDGIDAISDEDAGIMLLRGLGLIDENYRIEKSYIDNILATIGIIPGATAIIKGKKLTEFIEKLNPSQLKKFNEAKEKVSSAIKNKNPFKKGNKVEKVKDLKKVEKVNSKILKTPEEALNNINKKFNSQLEKSIKSLKEGESLDLGVAQITRQKGGLFEKSYEVKIGETTYNKNSIKEVQELIAKEKTSIVNKLEHIQKSELEAQAKRLKTFGKKGEEIGDGVKFHKEGKFINKEGKILEFEKLSNTQKITAIEKVFEMKGLDNFLDELINSNILKNISKAGGTKPGSTTKAEACNNIWASIQRPFKWAGNENIINSASNSGIGKAVEAWSSKDRLSLNPLTWIPATINGIYIPSRNIAKFLINYGPNRTLHNIGTAKGYGEGIRASLTGEKKLSKMYILGMLAAGIGFSALDHSSMSKEEKERFNKQSGGDQLIDLGQEFTINVLSTSWLKWFQFPIKHYDVDIDTLD